MIIYLKDYFENFIENNCAKLDDSNLEKLEKDVAKVIDVENEIYLNFDGGFGYTKIFIELIIDFLSNRFMDNNISKRIIVISEDEPSIIQFVHELLKRK